MLLRRPILAVAAIAVCAATGLAQQTVTIRPSADNTLYETPTGSTSNGAGTAMFAGRNAGTVNSIRRALVLFDIAANLPAGATILSADLTLFNDAANESPQPITLHRVLESWGEGSSAAGGPSGGGRGAAAQPGDATWRHRAFNSSFWTTPGGTFDAVVSATTTVAGGGSYNWTSTQLAADVQAFLDAPSSNFGWLLQGNELVTSSAKRFATREETDLSRQPALTITFIPAPSAALALAGLASLAALRRRRQTERSQG